MTDTIQLTKGQVARFASSKHVGVNWEPRRKKWRAQIQISGKRLTLGSFDTEIEAYRAYQTSLKGTSR